MRTIDINTLTPEERLALLQSVSPEELKAAAKAAEASKFEAREAYKETVQDAVPGFIKTLLNISGMLSQAKLDLFQGCKILLILKLMHSPSNRDSKVIHLQIKTETDYLWF